MKTTTEKIDGCQVVLNVEADEEEMERAIKGAYSRVGAKTIVPGFRKGKAPRAMLEHYFGREAIVQDAAEHILPDMYEKAIEENEIEGWSPGIHLNHCVFVASSADEICPCYQMMDVTRCE